MIAILPSLQSEFRDFRLPLFRGGPAGRPGIGFRLFETGQDLACPAQSAVGPQKHPRHNTSGFSAMA